MNDARKKYADIIDLPHHESKNFPRMSMYERAAQFSAFDAVTGHSDAIKEQARQVDAMVEITEEDQRNLNIKMAEIYDKIDQRPKITIKYFVADKRKNGGKYLTFSGQLKRISEVDKALEFTNGFKIKLEQIYDILE